MHTGLKLSSRGYSSIGDSVPLVMKTLWNFSNTGRTASEASRQHSWNTGSGMFGYRSSYGSRISEKPAWYVPTRVPKSATSETALYSSVSTISNVFNRLVSRS